MAIVTLTEMWLHAAADLSDFVVGDGFGEGGPEDAVAGDVRQYAGGRRRVVRRAGRVRVYERTFRSASETLIDWLDDHLGETVLVRDPKGRRFWAVYFSLPVPDRHGPVRPDVTVLFQSVSWSEVV